MIKKIKHKIYKKFFKEYHAKPYSPNTSDFSNSEKEIIQQVLPYTLTGQDRLIALLRAVQFLEKNNISGNIVECGVWKGGSIMAILRQLKELNNLDREVYLYDTFEGMSKPTEYDNSINGESASEAFKNEDEVWNRIECSSPLDEVKNNVASVGYPSGKIHFIEGKVEDTISAENAPESIALLRLDTDWYESTKHEMETLFPKLVKGGILIIDDYGHWEGCKKAIDEYMNKHNLSLHLVRIDYTCRLAVKN